VLAFKKRILFGALLIAGALQAQDGPPGHWTGAIDSASQSLAVKIDLGKTAKEWVGSFATLAQQASPLESISVTNGQLRFRIEGGPGEPTFNAALRRKLVVRAHACRHYVGVQVERCPHGMRAGRRRCSSADSTGAESTGSIE
jgi:hypothetical protein